MRLINEETKKLLQPFVERGLRGLAGQGWRKSQETGTKDVNSCRYHMADGRRCFVGHMLSKEDAIRADAEALPVTSILRYGMLPELYGEDDVRYVLQELQAAHDRAFGDRVLQSMQQAVMGLGFEWPEGLDPEEA